MPVLARRIEAAGIPTVIVTMMPSVAEGVLSPRIVGVEFPFGHPFGLPHSSPLISGPAAARAIQRTVLETALRVLAGAPNFGTRVDLDIEWPQPRGEAYKAWQPAEPSPIVAAMLAGGRGGGGTTSER